MILITAIIQRWSGSENVPGNARRYFYDRLRNGKHHIITRNITCRLILCTTILFSGIIFLGMVRWQIKSEICYSNGYGWVGHYGTFHYISFTFAFWIVPFSDDTFWGSANMVQFVQYYLLRVYLYVIWFPTSLWMAQWNSYHGWFSHIFVPNQAVGFVLFCCCFILFRLFSSHALTCPHNKQTNKQVEILCKFEKCDFMGYIRVNESWLHETIQLQRDKIFALFGPFIEPWLSATTDGPSSLVVNATN